MKLFKSRPFALFVMVAAIVVACVHGMHTKPVVEVPDGAVPLDDSLSTAYYEEYIIDEANVLSNKTEKTLSLYNANWDELAGRILTVVTTKNVGDVEDAAWDWAYNLSLGNDDAILLIDTASKDYIVVTSGSFYDDFSTQSGSFVDNAMYEWVKKGDYDTAVQNLFAEVHLLHRAESYRSNTYIGPIFLLLIVILVLIFIFSMVDSTRYSRWNARYGAMPTPPVVYRPVLWWHRPGSRWYRNRRNPVPPPPPTPPRPPHSGGTRPPTGGSTHRPPRPPMGGGYTPTGGHRPTNSGSHPQSGSFGGGHRGGNFGSSNHSGSFGGGNRSGNFGGSSRGGNFGGGNRGGSFGGGNRGGGFGGRR